MRYLAKSMENFYRIGRSEDGQESVECTSTKFIFFTSLAENEFFADDYRHTRPLCTQSFAQRLTQKKNLFIWRRSTKFSCYIIIAQLCIIRRRLQYNIMTVNSDT